MDEAADAIDDGMHDAMDKAEEVGDAMEAKKVEIDAAIDDAGSD
jgi:hypothetical protein